MIRDSFVKAALATAVGSWLALSGGAVMAASNAKYLLQWSGDKGGWHTVSDPLIGEPALLDDDSDPNFEVNGKGPATTGTPDGDFLAVVNANPLDIFNYGKVVSTARMPSVVNAHLLAEVEFGLPDGVITVPDGPSGDGGGLFHGITSNFANESHHGNATLIVRGGKKLLYLGGLISANVFGCDVTDALNVRPIHNTIVSGDVLGAVVRYNIATDASSNAFKNMCGLVVNGGAGIQGTQRLSGTDDFVDAGEGWVASSWMGSKGNFAGDYNLAPSLPPTLMTPGGVVLFNEDGTSVKEYIAALDPTTPVGTTGQVPPTRYKPRWECVTCGPGPLPPLLGGPRETVAPNTGPIAHPHAIYARPDLNTLVTGDYSDPVSLALAGATPFLGDPASTQVYDMGTTARFWDLKKLRDGLGVVAGDDQRPLGISQMPDGPRVEGGGGSSVTMEEPEGLMPGWKTNLPGNKGAFMGSMCGGTLFYANDMTTWQKGKNPVFTALLDTGPCTGFSVFFTTKDDNYIVVPIAGIVAPGQPTFGRDYPLEHTRRVMLIDIRPTIKQGTKKIKCSYADASTYVQNGPPHDYTGEPTTSFAAFRNNGASDCPIIVDQTSVDSLDNFLSQGGPHFTNFNNAETRVATALYFVDLREYALPAPVGQLPGTASVGDNRLCMLTMTKSSKVGFGTMNHDLAFGLFTDVQSSGNDGQRYEPHFFFTYLDGCIDFDRQSWPDGLGGTLNTGHATPHSVHWWEDL